MEAQAPERFKQERVINSVEGSRDIEEFVRMD